MLLRKENRLYSITRGRGDVCIQYISAHHAWSESTISQNLISWESAADIYLKFNLLAAGQTEKKETQKRRVSLTTEYAQSGIGPVSGVHSIMMEKLAQPGEGCGCAHTPFFTVSTITYKAVVQCCGSGSGIRDQLPF